MNNPWKIHFSSLSCFKNPRAYVLRASGYDGCSVQFQSFTSSQHAHFTFLFQSRGRIVLLETIDEILSNVEEAGEEVGKISFDESSDQILDHQQLCLVRLRIALSRLQCLLTVEQPCVIDRQRVFTTLRSAMEMASNNPKIASYSAASSLACYELVLMWASEEFDSSEDTENLTEIKKESEKLLECLTAILGGDHEVDICWNALKVLLDLYMIWSFDKVRDTKFHTLGFQLGECTFSRLWEVVSEKLIQAHEEEGAGDSQNIRVCF